MRNNHNQSNNDEARITAKGQVTIPLAIRRKLGLKPHDMVRVVLDQGGVRITPTSAQSSATVDVHGRSAVVTPPAQPADETDARSAGTSGALTGEEIGAARAANLALAEQTRAILFAPPSPEVLARRQAAAARMQARWANAVTTPWTGEDAIHEARAEEAASYGQSR